MYFLQLWNVLFSSPKKTFNLRSIERAAGSSLLLLFVGINDRRDTNKQASIRSRAKENSVKTNQRNIACAPSDIKNCTKLKEFHRSSNNIRKESRRIVLSGKRKKRKINQIFWVNPEYLDCSTTCVYRRKWWFTYYRWLKIQDSHFANLFSPSSFGVANTTSKYRCRHSWDTGYKRHT